MQVHYIHNNTKIRKKTEQSSYLKEGVDHRVRNRYQSSEELA